MSDGNSRKSDGNNRTTHGILTKYSKNSHTIMEIAWNTHKILTNILTKNLQNSLKNSTNVKKSRSRMEIIRKSHGNNQISHTIIVIL